MMVLLTIGGLAFMIGLVLIGLSGSARHAGTWVGPAGALLLVAGLGIEVAMLAQG